MTKQVSKILVAVLLIALTVVAVDFDFSWADTEGSTEQNVVSTAIENVEGKMEFLYIENSEMESPGTQNIAVAWEQNMSDITEFTLVYSDNNNNNYEIKEANRTEKSVLFSKEFSSSETGNYKINGMKYLIEGSDEVQYLEFNDLDIKADFKVINDQSDSVTTVVDNNVATTSTDVDELSDDVEALLETSNVEPASNNGNVVIVIDPGHGGSQPGACSNGLKEKDLTLKIAKYFRDELKEYSGVEVYMTRETDRDVSDGGDDELSKRVEFAAKKNADLLVSVHINASGNGKGKGAEVWAPNKNYNFKAYEVGQAVAQDIQDELVKLGLANRGVQTSYSKNNTQYPDGSLADYYAIIRESKEKGFSGIIVEHAFIDNASDAAFLKSEENLKKLGVADATGIANYFGLQKIKAENIEEGTYTISPANNTAMTLIVSGKQWENEALIELSDKKALASSQRFEIIQVGKNEYKILAEHSGKALDVYASSAISGSKIQQYTDHEGSNQLWKFIDAGEGEFFIRSRMGTFLTLTEGGIEACAFDEMNENQKWVIEKTEFRPVDNGTYIIASKNDAKVLDVYGASKANGANVEVYKSNNQDNQQFEITYEGNGYYRIIAIHSRKSLDVHGASRRSGANLEQYQFSGTSNQLWKFVDAGDGNYYLKSKLGTVVSVAKNIVVNGTNVNMATMAERDVQKWTLSKIDIRPIEDGVYSIYSRLGNNKVMDIEAASMKDRGNILLWSNHNASNQRFIIKYIGGGYYSIIAEHSGKSLDIYGASSKKGANLIQYKYSGAPNQLWKFVDAGNGYYYIKSKLGTVIDLHGLFVHNGNNIEMFSFNGGKNQQWKLVNEDLTSIMGDSEVTVDDLVVYYEKSGKTYPYYSDKQVGNIEMFAQIYIEECEREGVRVEVAFCQAMKETGWLQFGGQVKKEQYNFAGLGATDGGASGAVFDTIREGVRAQVQHLKAYACEEELMNKCVDPRFDLVKRGCAPYVEWLGQKENPQGKGWASAKGYGLDIVKMINKLYYEV